MLRCDLWPAILDNDHWPADTPTVTCNEDGPVVVIDINADKLAESSCSPQPSEIADEARGVPSQADNGSVDIDDKRVGAIDLGPRR